MSHSRTQKIRIPLNDHEVDDLDLRARNLLNGDLAEIEAGWLLKIRRWLQLIDPIVVRLKCYGSLPETDLRPDFHCVYGTGGNLGVMREYYSGLIARIREFIECVERKHLVAAAGVSNVAADGDNDDI